MDMYSSDSSTQLLYYERRDKHWSLRGTSALERITGPREGNCQPQDYYTIILQSSEGARNSQVDKPVLERGTLQPQEIYTERGGPQLSGGLAKPQEGNNQPRQKLVNFGLRGIENALMMKISTIYPLSRIFRLNQCVINISQIKTHSTVLCTNNNEYLCIDRI